MSGRSSIIPFGIGGRARQIIIRRATIFIVSRLIIAQRVQLKRKDTFVLTQILDTHFWFGRLEHLTSFLDFVASLYCLITIFKGKYLIYIDLLSD